MRKVGIIFLFCALLGCEGGSPPGSPETPGLDSTIVSEGISPAATQMKGVEGDKNFSTLSISDKKALIAKLVKLRQAMPKLDTKSTEPFMLIMPDLRYSEDQKPEVKNLEIQAISRIGDGLSPNLSNDQNESFWNGTKIILRIIDPLHHGKLMIGTVVAYLFDGSVRGFCVNLDYPTRKNPFEYCIPTWGDEKKDVVEREMTDQMRREEFLIKMEKIRDDFKKQRLGYEASLIGSIEEFFKRLVPTQHDDGTMPPEESPAAKIISGWFDAVAEAEDRMDDVLNKLGVVLESDIPEEIERALENVSLVLAHAMGIDLLAQWLDEMNKARNLRLWGTPLPPDWVSNPPGQTPSQTPTESPTPFVFIPAESPLTTHAPSPQINNQPPTVDVRICYGQYLFQDLYRLYLERRTVIRIMAFLPHDLVPHYLKERIPPSPGIPFVRYRISKEVWINLQFELNEGRSSLRIRANDFHYEDGDTLAQAEMGYDFRGQQQPIIVVDDARITSVLNGSVRLGNQSRIGGLIPLESALSQAVWHIEPAKNILTGCFDREVNVSQQGVIDMNDTRNFVGHTKFILQIRKDE